MTCDSFVLLLSARNCSMRFGVAGRVDTIFKMKASVDTCRSFMSSEQGSGALESASGIHKCFQLCVHNCKVVPRQA